MSDVILPVGIQVDIEETFCFDKERSYQDRAHEYICRYEVPRPWRRGNTAVQSAVEHLCRRSFEAGAQMTCAATVEERSVARTMTRAERGRYFEGVLRDFLDSGADVSTVPVMDGDSPEKLANGLRWRARNGKMPVIVTLKNRKVYLIREES